MILPIPIYIHYGESTELNPTVHNILMIVAIVVLLVELYMLLYAIGIVPDIYDVVDTIRSKTHKYIEAHKPKYIIYNLKTYERMKIMNPVKIKNEVHNVTEVIFKQVGNSMTGNITRYYMTDNPNILYRVDYKEWEFYTEEFVRRDQI